MQLPWLGKLVNTGFFIGFFPMNEKYAQVTRLRIHVKIPRIHEKPPCSCRCGFLRHAFLDDHPTIETEVSIHVSIFKSYSSRPNNRIPSFVPPWTNQKIQPPILLLLATYHPSQPGKVVRPEEFLLVWDDVSKAIVVPGGYAPQGRVTVQKGARQTEVPKEVGSQNQIIFNQKCKPQDVLNRMNGCGGCNSAFFLGCIFFTG